MKLGIIKLFLIFFVFVFLGQIFSLHSEKFLTNSSTKNLASVFSLARYLKNKTQNEFKSKEKNFKMQNEDKLKSNSGITNNLKNSNTENSKLGSIMQGWLKYLEMNDSSSEVPSTFNKNNVYFLQMSENPSINTIAKDNIGFINIPNDQYHYFELLSNSINVFTARPGKYRNFREKLIISDVIPLSSINPCRGGIEDVGSFSEGFCFLIKFIRFSKHFIWEVCADTIYEKNNWIQNLIKVISSKAPVAAVVTPPVIGISSGISVLPSPQPYMMSPPPVNLGIPTPSYPVNFGIPVPSYPPSPLVSQSQIAPIGPLGTPGSLPSGYTLFQDWTPCNKPCDTGFQTRILDCVDVSICVGRKLEDRLCNVQKCKEDVDTSLENLKKVSNGQWEYLGTWTKCSKACGGGIRSIQRRCISGSCDGDTVVTEDCNNVVCQNMIGSDPDKMEISVFERESFDECKLLEGNLMMMVRNNRVLSHVEVNTQEIQIIRQDDPLHPITIPIAKLLNINPSNKAPGCMDVIDSQGKNIIMCPDAMKAVPIDLWIQRIRDFKTICAKRLLTKMETEISQSLNSLKDPNSSLKNLDNVQAKILGDQKLKNKIKQKALEDQLEEFKRQTKDLLTKEESYESKLEKQEQERMEFEKHRMNEEIKRQTESAQNLLNDMKNLAEADSEYKIKELSVKREMQNIMKEVEDKLNEKRTSFVNKIQRMKNIHELSKKKAALQLIDVKRNIGKQLTGLSTKGDPNQCFIKNPVMQNEYCTRKFPNSFDMQLECKKPKQFCYICCDTEIPALEKMNVACCYKKCDDLDDGQCKTFNEIYVIHNDQIAFMR